MTRAERKLSIYVIGAYRQSIESLDEQESQEVS